MARILVIDDESNIRLMLRLALAHVGHEVDTAADGLEGLDRFGAGERWDVVLLDQRMPGLEGLEVLREIRRRRADARVVMITAFGTVDLATEAISAGATDFLRKPFTIETLRAAVDAALAGLSAGHTPAAGSSPAVPFAFDLTTVNGYRLRPAGEISPGADSAVGADFIVRCAGGAERPCRVTLPAYVIELVKAYADREEMPGGERFWQALCGEALANHLWQNADLPPADSLVVDDLTSGLRHWIDAVLSASGK